MKMTGPTLFISKAWDGRRVVKFCAVTAIHERNKEFAHHTSVVEGLKA